MTPNQHHQHSLLDFIYHNIKSLQELSQTEDRITGRLFDLVVQVSTDEVVVRHSPGIDAGTLVLKFSIQDWTRAAQIRQLVYASSREQTARKMIEVAEKSKREA